MASRQAHASTPLDPDESLTELTDRAEGLRSAFSQAHAAALRTAAALSEGLRPDSPDLDAVTGAVEGFDSVAAALEQTGGSQGPPAATLDELETADGRKASSSTYVRSVTGR